MSNRILICARARTVRYPDRTVARLAGRGLSNKEIAAQLYVSVRTVGNQLQSAYTKLGVHDRRELSDVYAAGR